MPRFRAVRHSGAGTASGTMMLAKTNSAGADLAFTASYTGILDSLYWNVQMAADGAFTTALPGEAAIRDEIRTLTTTDQTDDDVDGTIESDQFFSMFGQGAGARYLRLRLGTSNAAGDGFDWNSWSNTISETIATASPIQWSSVDKSNSIVLSGSNLIAAGLNGLGSPAIALATNGKDTGKWYFEALVNVGTSFGAVVVGLASFMLPDDGNIPGSVTSDAISYHANSVVYRNSGNDAGANQSDYSFLTGLHVIGVAFDADAKKVWFAQGNTFAGAPASGTGGHSPTGIGPYFPMAGSGDDGETVALRTVTSQFTYSPPSGFLPFGGS